MARREYAARGCLLQSPRGQPRRDRDSHLPHAAGAGDRDRGRLLGGRSCIPARLLRGRGLPDRRGCACRELSQRGADHRNDAEGRCRGRPSRVRLSGRERGLCTSLGRCGPRLDRAAARGDGGDELEDTIARAHAGGGCADHSRNDRAGFFALAGNRARRRVRLAACDQGGGGGKGLKVARSPDEVERAFATAQREGESYFADPTVYVERYLEDPRHVEVQVLADSRGNVIYLGERDCTIQRRHQKLVEETPSPVVDGDLRGRIGKIAIEAARAVGYQNAGTIEGLLSSEGEYFFLEMNTRIQVEHTVTELVTGIDLVREQVLIAAGEELSVKQGDVSFVGHAIECRINAEDPVKGFLPGPGTITVYREPGGPGVRVDSGVTAGSEVSGLYDPLIAKLCVHGADREQARARMLRALEEYVIDGVPTLISFHRALLSHPCFVAGETCEGIVESRELAERAAELTSAHSESAAAGEKLAPRTSFVELDGRRFEVKLLVPEAEHRELATRRRERGATAHHAAGRDAVVSPMQGTVLAVEVEEGDEVSAGQVLCIVEAMKMENEITAHREGTVMELSVSPGASVTTGQVLCVIVQDDG